MRLKKTTIAGIILMMSMAAFLGLALYAKNKNKKTMNLVCFEISMISFIVGIFMFLYSHANNASSRNAENRYLLFNQRHARSSSNGNNLSLTEPSNSNSGSSSITHDGILSSFG